jgi:hypothetical protein
MRENRRAAPGRALRHAEFGLKLTLVSGFVLAILSISAGTSIAMQSSAVFLTSPGTQSSATSSPDEPNLQAASEAYTSPFTIHLASGQTKFHQGERITLELDYLTGRASSSSAVVGGEHEWIRVDALHLDPESGVTDPLQDYLAGVNFMGGIPPRSMPVVEGGAQPVPMDLNEWFRFDKPGVYRLFLTGRTSTTYYGVAVYDDSSPLVTSNTIQFLVLPADPAWSAQELARAIGWMEAKSQKAYDGCRTMRFLGTQAAASEMVKQYSSDPLCEGEFRLGLFGFPDREFAARQMRARLTTPDQPVSEDYLQTLAKLSVYLLHPDTNSIHPLGGGFPETYDQVQAQEAIDVWILVDALAKKTGQARAICLKTIFDSPLAGDATLLPGAPPALVSKLKQELAAAFFDLPEADQDMMLRIRWEKFGSPAMIPVLKRLYQNPGTHVYPPTSGIALRRLYELDPVEGRRLILSEIESAHPRVGIEALGVLPNKELPELESVIARNLAADHGDDDTLIALIERYASPDVFPEVLAATENLVGKMACVPQAALLAYFLRSDPETGRKMLERAMVSQTTGCRNSVLMDTARLYNSPQIEAVATAQLGDPNPEVAAAAATLLGRYGSAAAEPALWQRFEQWHSVWEGREQELPDTSWGEGMPNSSEASLETALFNALATGQAWWLEDEKLRRLQALCVSRWTARNADQVILQASADPMIAVNSFGSATYSVSLAQYQLDSIEATKQKLAQFPKGTSFTLQLNGSDAAEMTRVATDLKSVLGEHDMKIAGCRFWQGVPAESELPNASPESPCHSLPTIQDAQPRAAAETDHQE